MKNKVNENNIYCKALRCETIKNKKKLFSLISNSQTYYHFKLDFQKIDQHTGGKWLIHGTKRHKDNQLQSLDVIDAVLCINFIKIMTYSCVFFREIVPCTLLQRSEYSLPNNWTISFSSVIPSTQYMIMLPLTMTFNQLPYILVVWH